MGSAKIQPTGNSPEPSDGRLDSWKEIAAYLRRDERTVRRWEMEGMPVHRKVHKKQASVYAYKTEVDAWWHGGRQQLESNKPSNPAKHFTAWVWTGAAFLISSLAILAVFNVGALRDRLLGKPTVAPEIRSIAVLPLENLSRDPAQEYFAEGMTEELTTELAQISSLKVISHTSVVQYQGSRKSMPQIARDLGVDAVVEGAVEQSGDGVEITVQLIHAPTDRHFWGKSYQRRLRDVLDLQREVTHSITDELRTKLTGPEQTRLSSRRTMDSEAYQDYLHGRYLLSTYDNDINARKAISYFQLAIQKDPNCALAYAGVAEAYITLGQPWDPALPPNEVLTKAKLAAATAIAIDDSLSEAHSALAHVIELYDWDWPGAEKQYRKALEINPNDVTAHFWYGEYLQAMGRADEGIAQIQAAIVLDPLNPAHLAELGSQFFMARQYDNAIRTFQKTLDMEPDYVWALTGLGWIYEQKKMYGDAIAEFEKSLRLSNRSDDSLADLGKALGESGRRQEARKILVELTERSKHRYVSPYLIAYVQVGLGDRDKAFEFLQEGLAERDQWMLYLKVDPQWDDLRSDPRFEDLLHRVGLVQHSRSSVPSSEQHGSQRAVPASWVVPSRAGSWK